MRSLIFDTETSDMFDFKKPLDHPDQPDVIQIAWYLLDEDTDLIMGDMELFVQTERPIAPGAFKAHGITHEMLNNFGVSQRVAMAFFNNVLKQADQVVTHNTEFDLKMMQVAYLRQNQGANQFDQKRQFCTMRNSTDICKIPNPKRPTGFKWPSMQEAYQILVDPAGFKDAHRAKADATACLAVYRRLKALRAAA